MKTTETKTLPTDEFSTALRSLQNNPGAVVRASSIDLEDFYGNVVTWHIKTIRADGADTVFLQRNTAEGGDRVVLPPEVMAVIVRQRDGAVSVNRRRGAARAAATREAKGIRPAFSKKASAR
jgi:hypothetical protein